jgi:hypothetical protein
LVEIEGNSKPEFAGFVIVNIKEEPAENFSMGGIQASAEFFGISN